MTKEIPLTKGQVAIVDDWWYEELNAYKWHATWNPYTQSYYAVRMSKMLFGKQKTIQMHAVVAGTPKGMKTDHVNHNTLENTEENLRVCTHAQNMMNSGKYANNTSGFKGVTANGKGWRAQIGYGGEIFYLGIYPTREEAARVYDEEAKRLHGEFAVLNFPSHSSDN